MGSKPVSPQRPRGPGTPATASVIQDHGHAAQQQVNLAGSSRSSLFGLFRRRQSQSSTAPSAAPRAAPSVGGSDSYLGAFDNFSLGPAAAGVEAPHETKAAGRKVARMLDAAARYGESIRQMSAASAELGAALYECADTRGAAAGRTSLPGHGVDSDFQAAAGLQLLISNHASVLASSMASKFNEPVRREHAEHERRVAAKEAEFRSGLRAKLQALREAEQQNIRDSRRRTRDLLSYRSTLLDLTSQIDDINRFKFDFLSDLHAMSTELAESVHRALASAVTAEIEVFDSIARKGWSGGGLDGLLAGCPDPFEPEARAGSADADAASLGSARRASEQSQLRPASSASSERASVSSSNLFSVLPQSSILPAALGSDEDGDAATLSRRNSGLSDIADLTLTPPRQPSLRSSGSVQGRDGAHENDVHENAAQDAAHESASKVHEDTAEDKAGREDPREDPREHHNQGGARHTERDELADGNTDSPYGHGDKTGQDAESSGNKASDGAFSGKASSGPAGDVAASDSSLH